MSEAGEIVPVRIRKEPQITLIYEMVTDFLLRFESATWRFLRFNLHNLSRDL